MKRSKRLSVLLGILVVACIATFAVMQMEEKKEQIKNSGEIVLEVPSDDVQSLSWEYGGESLAFHKDGTWLYDDDEAFPVDEDKIHDLLEQFESFGVSFIIEDATDLGLYGLDDPVCTIQFATEERSYEITLGDYSNMDSERYVSIGDGNVYLAKVDPLESFDAVLRDMIRHDRSLSYDEVSQIKFEGAENYSIFHEEGSDAAYSAEDVYFTAQAGSTVPLDSGRVGTYLENLALLDLSNYVTYNATEEELAAFGLDSPELTITVDYTAGDADGKEASDTFTLSVSRDPEELAALAEAEEAGEEDKTGEEGEEEITAYARVGESQIVYQISEYDYNNLMAASFNQLRHREALPADFAGVYQVDILLEDTEYTLAADGKGDDRVWKYREEEIEIAGFQDALEQISAEYSDSFTAEKPSGRKEISLTLHLDHETYPTWEIVLYRYDGSDCIATVNGRPFALISRSDAVELIESVNAIVLN